MSHYTAYELGLDYHGAYADVDAGEVTVTLVDHTAFHRERHPELFDEDGWLTTPAWAALVALAEERYGAALSVGNDGDEPHVSFEWTFEAPDDVQAISEHIWPLVVHVLNETDPGTFGARYVYADVAKELS